MVGLAWFCICCCKRYMIRVSFWWGIPKNCTQPPHFSPVYSTKPLSSFWTHEELPVAIFVDTHFFWKGVSICVSVLFRITKNQKVNVAISFMLSDNVKMLRICCRPSVSYWVLQVLHTKKKTHPEGHWCRNVLGHGKGSAPSLVSPLDRKGGWLGCMWLAGKECSSDLGHADFLLSLPLNRSIHTAECCFPPSPPVFSSELIRNSLSSDKPLKILSLEQVFLLQLK